MKKTLIERIEVPSGGQAAIEFTSIPADYTDLYLITSIRSTRSTNFSDYSITINGDTATNYSYRRLYGTGSATASSSAASQTILYTGTLSSTFVTANTFSSTSIYIPNYTSSNGKSVSVDNVAENNGTAGFQNLIAGLWNNSAAITSIKITSPSWNLVQYSSASLYGITAGNDGITTVS